MLSDREAPMAVENLDAAIDSDDNLTTATQARFDPI
jgi:hypothetical protein